MYLENVEAAGLTSRFHFLGPLPPFEVVPFAANANASLILYYPRSLDYRFALPNKFFQSIAAGLPTLYPDLSEIRRLAEDYEVGLMIDPMNPDSIAEAILQLVNKPCLCAELSKRAKRASEKLSWEHEEIALRRLMESEIGCQESKVG